MNRGATEILQCLNIPHNINRDGCEMEMKQLERNQDPMKWQHEQSLTYINNGDDNHMFMFSTPPVEAQQFQGLINIDQGLSFLLSDQELKQEPVFETAWNAFDGNSVGDYSRVPGFDINHSIPRTISCPAAAMAEAALAAGKDKEATSPPEKISSILGRESFKKRKLEKTRSQKVITEEQAKDKKMKGFAQEGDSKITEQHSNNSKSEPSVDASKVSEVKKPDFIHVRARRGQATDSHSLAERVRREKISERMKFLQDLVPGCNKIVGKAGMLDEIINYVQSLQRQVEFLSMKLATVNHSIDFNIESFFTKEQMEMGNPANLQFNPVPQVVSCPGMQNSISPPDMALRRTISAPVSLPETLLDQSCFNQIQHSSNWETNFQNLYAMELEQEKSASVFSEPFSGYIEGGGGGGGGDVKLEI